MEFVANYIVPVLASIVFLMFLSMYIHRHRSKGTIALHRHPDNVRRRRYESVESPEITQGWQI